MKFLIAFVAFTALATASPYNKPTSGIDVSAILAAINHPNTDPATAALLWDQLESMLHQESPISVGPAIVEDPPISVGPAIVEDSPASVEEVPAVPVLPAVPTPSKSPLVQIIVNVNTNAAGNPVEVEPTPVVPEIVPTPVIVVENAETEPENVIVGPVIVPSPVDVVEEPEQSPEPVIIAPIEVAPVVVLPDILN